MKGLVNDDGSDDVREYIVIVIDIVGYSIIGSVTSLSVGSVPSSSLSLPLVSRSATVSLKGRKLHFRTFCICYDYHLFHYY